MVCLWGFLRPCLLLCWIFLRNLDLEHFHDLHEVARRARGCRLCCARRSSSPRKIGQRGGGSRRRRRGGRTPRGRQRWTRDQLQQLHQLNVHCPTWEKNGLLFYLPMFTYFLTPCLPLGLLYRFAPPSQGATSTREPLVADDDGVTTVGNELVDVPRRGAPQTSGTSPRDSRQRQFRALHPAGAELCEPHIFVTAA
jgi:hypothetical protein